jgi:hypothetical protein
MTDVESILPTSGYTGGKRNLALLTVRLIDSTNMSRAVRRYGRHPS